MTGHTPTWKAEIVPCVDCRAQAPEPPRDCQRARCESCNRRRSGELLDLARAITFATRMPAHSEADDALGIDHGYHAAGEGQSNGLECDLIEETIIELALDPEEVASLLWAVVDYQHQPIEELRNMALYFEGGRPPGYQFIEGLDEDDEKGQDQ